MAKYKKKNLHDFDISKDRKLINATKQKTMEDHNDY